MRHSQGERREKKIEVLLVKYSFWSKMCFRFLGYRPFLLGHNSKLGGGGGGACDQLVSPLQQVEFLRQLNVPPTSKRFCFIFTFGIFSLLLTLNFASVYMWLTSPHLVGLPCQSLTFSQKKCFLHLMWSKLKLAIWFRIMRFHLDMRLCIIDPVLMSFDDGTGPAPEVLKILLLKKMTKGRWRGPAAESAIFFGARFLHLRHKNKQNI